MSEANTVQQSPSGLFTRWAWASDRQAASEPAPAASAGDDRAFARWVHGQAKTLASQLDRLAQAEASPPLARQLAAVADALWADAEWARRLIDGSFAEAAE